MAETMKLLEKALEKQSATAWTRDLNLHRNALSTAKHRGNLSPSIAGAMAEALGLDAIKWIAVAALESDKESTCKARMVRKFGRITAVYRFNFCVAYMLRFS